MVNKVTLIGHVGNDPELKYTQSGVAILKFNMATNETYKDKEGNKKTDTEWHRITMWGNAAETFGQYVHKGGLVYVEGKIKTDTWENEEGVTQYSTGIVANTLRMLDSKGQA